MGLVFRVHLACSAFALRQAALATLNQNEQHDYKQNSRDYSDDCDVIHLVSFPDSKADASTLALYLYVHNSANHVNTDRHQCQTYPYPFSPERIVEHDVHVVRTDEV